MVIYAMGSALHTIDLPGPDLYFMSSLNYMVGAFYTISVLHAPKQFKKNLKNRCLIGIRTNGPVGDCLSSFLNF